MSNSNAGTDLESIERIISKPKSAFPTTTDFHKQIHSNEQLSPNNLFGAQDHAYTLLRATENRHIQLLEEKLNEAKANVTSNLPDVTAPPGQDAEEFRNQVKSNICIMVEQRWNCEERTEKLKEV